MYPANGKIASLGKGILHDSIAISKLMPNGPINVIIYSIKLIKCDKIKLINSILPPLSCVIVAEKHFILTMLKIYTNITLPKGV